MGQEFRRDNVHLEPLAGAILPTANYGYYHYNPLISFNVYECENTLLNRRYALPRQRPPGRYT